MDYIGEQMGMNTKTLASFGLPNFRKYNGVRQKKKW